MPYPTNRQWIGLTEDNTGPSRWGKLGVEAQRMARGEDRREIRPELRTLSEPVEIDAGVPIESFDDLVKPLVAKLSLSLEQIAQPLEGVTRLALSARGFDHSTYAAERRFGDPLTTPAMLERTILSELTRFSLSAPLVALSAHILSCGECELRQLSLFGDPSAKEASGAAALPDALREKHAGVFVTPTARVPAHPILDQRYRWEGV